MSVCQLCKSRPAKIHYTEIVNNNMVTLELCVECAEEKGIDVQKSGPYGLGDLVAGLIDTAVDGESDRIGKVRCPGCGYNYSDFKKIGRFGCPQCYEAFEVQLTPLLRHVHGGTKHAGKHRKQTGERVSVLRRVSELKEDLTRAIASEDYERAALLRDEIREIEGAPEKKAEESPGRTPKEDV